MRLIAGAVSVVLFCCGLVVLAQAQQGTPVGPNAPCSAFGTAAGTCAQGNDSRITGAVQSGGSLGTPSDGTVTNLTGTASININGTVGATTAAAGKFTTVNASTNVSIGAGSAITSSGAGGALGSAAFVNTGTSGSTVPLLNATATVSADWLFTGGPQQISLGANGGTEGAILFNGATSGSWSFGTTATGGPLWGNLPNAAENQIICYNGSTGAVSYESSVAGCVPSDPKLKNKGPTLDPKVALAKIAMIEPGSGSFKQNTGLGSNQQVWLYADQVCAMDSRLCVKDTKGILNYDKVGMLAYLVAAVKAQQQEITSLRNRWCFGKWCW